MHYSAGIRGRLLAVALAVIAGWSLRAAPGKEATARGTFYLVAFDANVPVLRAVSSETICHEPNLVVITHGWYEREPWPGTMAVAIARKVDRGHWRCGWYDWRPQARRLRPYDATKTGRERIGPALADEILRLSNRWRHIHLIGHSAGTWVVSKAASIIAPQTQAGIHITFLDAYVPSGWDERVLSRIACDRPRRCWVEHYFTRDLLNFTENVLTGAHNVDVTDVNPGFNGHRFPIFWYLATITGGYDGEGRFTDEPVYRRANGEVYGFARTRECGPQAWTHSTALRPSGKSVPTLSKDKKPQGPPPG